jgi:transposase
VSCGPHRNGQNKERDARIAKLRAQGVGTRALAERFRLSATYVANILKRARKSQ